jgi:nudix-type nucleoside diphosphatase (YffH/AdpP family)
MSDLFCFGTLRHLPLLETVLGQIGHLTITPARLPQFEIRAVEEGPFPMLRPRAGSMADGILLSGLRGDDWARLDYYEGAFDYKLRDVTLADGRAAQCYFPPEGQFTDAGAWDLPGWQRLWGQTSCFAAREVIGYLGTKVARDVGVMFPNIRARAWAAVNAEQSRHGAGCFAGRVVVEQRQRSYAKFYALDDFEIRHERFDGTMTPVLSRASFIGTDAAIVLPYDPLRDCVALVEQIRVGPLARGDRQLWQLEPIAGRIDAGEAPDQTARREAMEEAGITITDLHAVAETYASPGCSSEFFYVYVGIADLGALAGQVGGLDSEHEDIKTHVMPFERLMTLCGERRAANAPLVMAAYWLAHHRAALLRSGGALVRDE